MEANTEAIKELRQLDGHMQELARQEGRIRLLEKVAGALTEAIVKGLTLKEFGEVLVGQFFLPALKESVGTIKLTTEQIANNYGNLN